MHARHLLALTLLGFAMGASAAVAVPASVEELARTSDAVVHGRVRSVGARWSSDGRRIFTRVEVEVATVLLGSAPSRLTVVVPGGVVGDLGQRVDGAAAFAGHEEVVVFLERTDGSAFRVRGLAQGKFSVANGVARPDLSHLAFAPRALRAGERRAEAMAVEELERRVKGAR